jgi:hypothetical protein
LGQQHKGPEERRFSFGSKLFCKWQFNMKLRVLRKLANSSQNSSRNVAKLAKKSVSLDNLAKHLSTSGVNIPRN